MALVVSSFATVDVEEGVVLRVRLSGAGTEGLRQTGRILWPSGRDIIAAVLVPRRASVVGRRVLELGAGAAGAPGQCASILGASDVLITDIQENCSSLRENIALNAASHRGHISACAFEWQDSDGTGGGRLPSEVLEFKPDLVICADCVFDGTERVLASTLATILTAFPSTEIWMVNIVILGLRTFKRALEDRGLRITALSCSTTGRTMAENIPKVRWQIGRATTPCGSSHAA
jgi:hypothetical protein